MKKILFVIALMASLAMFTATASAASAKLSGSVTKSIKSGQSISGSEIVIAMSGNELNHFKDSITVTVNNATWDYNESGQIADNITYEKTEPNVLKLHFNTNEELLKNGLTAKIPANFTVTRVAAKIEATVDYGYDDINDSVVQLATGSVSKLRVDKVRTVNTGDRFYGKNNEYTYSKLYVDVVAADAEKVAKSKLTISFEGFRLTDYKENGSVTCNRGQVATYVKSSDSSSLTITFDTCNAEMKTRGFTLTLPLTGTVTGTGENKAVANFGAADADESEIVISKVSGGSISAQAEDSSATVDKANTVSSVIIKDDTLNGYNSGKKIYLQLNQVFHFSGALKVEGTGKFENGCNITIDKNDAQKAVINFTKAIQSGSTGTIKIVSPYIERSENATNKFESVEMSITSDIWKDYNISPVTIAKYRQGTDSQSPIIVKVGKVADAKKYSAVQPVTISSPGRTFKAGSKITLGFDCDFKVFEKGKLPSVKGTGSFENNCNISISKGLVYITIPNAVSASASDTITVSGIVLERESEESFEGFVTLTAIVDEDTTSVSNANVAKFSSLYDTVPETTTVAEASTETTTAAPTNSNGRVKFTIGSEEYIINGQYAKLLAPPYIKDGYTMLPMRAIANIVGISNDDISYSDGTAVFKISDSVSLSVTAGNSEYSLGGKSVTASTSAEIINGTMFLPMRDLANSIGISNDDISFNAETKEVTLNIKK